MQSSKAADTTLAGHLWTQQAGAPGVLRNIILAFAGSLFVAASAQVTVPMYPVPMTMQTFAVLVVGMAYGWRLGGATLLLYAAQGAMGLPVFASFAAGPGVLMGPTGGYIIGFVPAAMLAGWLAERGWDRNLWSTLLAMAMAKVAIFVPGLAWLTVFFATAGAAHVAGSGLGAAFSAAIAAGLMPFLIGAVLKTALAAAVLPLAWKLVKRRG